MPSHNLPLRITQIILAIATVVLNGYSTSPLPSSHFARAQTLQSNLLN